MFAGSAASGLVTVSDKEHSMSTTTSKHRATEPLHDERRPVSAHHRAGRSSDLPIAAALGIILLIVAAYLAVRR